MGFFKDLINLFLHLDDEGEMDNKENYFSTYFCEKEMIKSQTAIRHGINNKPNSRQLHNLKMLCQKILDPIREKFGPFTVSSGFRSEGLNLFLNGAKNSQHTKGEAADFEIFGVDNQRVFNWIRKNLKYDQLILEFYEEGVPNSGWVHVSYSELHNRGEALIATKENGRVKYARAD